MNVTRHDGHARPDGKPGRSQLGGRQQVGRGIDAGFGQDADQPALPGANGGPRRREVNRRATDRIASQNRSSWRKGGYSQYSRATIQWIPWAPTAR